MSGTAKDRVIKEIAIYTELYEKACTKVEILRTEKADREDIAIAITEQTLYNETITTLKIILSKFKQHEKYRPRRKRK